MNNWIMIVLSIFMLSGCSSNNGKIPSDKTIDELNKKEKKEDNIDKIEKALTIYELIG